MSDLRGDLLDKQHELEAAQKLTQQHESQLGEMEQLNLAKEDEVFPVDFNDVISTMMSPVVT